MYNISETLHNVQLQGILSPNETKFDFHNPDCSEENVANRLVVVDKLWQWSNFYPMLITEWLVIMTNQIAYYRVHASNQSSRHLPYPATKTLTSSRKQGPRPTNGRSVDAGADQMGSEDKKTWGGAEALT